MQTPATATAERDGHAPLRRRLDELVDRAPGVADLVHHRLGVIAADRWRRAGRVPAPPLETEERFAAQARLAAPLVLERVTQAYDGRIVVLKGPEVACRYPDPAMRPHHDLDLLAEDPAAAQRALVRAGCEVRIEQPSAHHELPLVFPDLPLVVEIHRAPLVPPWARVPVDELLAGAGPSAWAPDRALALPPAQHAVLVAAHAWVERPLRRVLDLVDVHVLMASADEDEAEAVAGRWGLGRLWRSTRAAAAHVLGDEPAPVALRTWARNAPAVRMRSRVESVAEFWLSPFGALPPLPAGRAAAAAIAHSVKPRAGEPWSARLHRDTHHPALTPDPEQRGHGRAGP